MNWSSYGRRYMKKIITILIVLFWNGNLKADAMSDYIFTNLQMDFTDCYAYYKISEEGVKRSNSDIKDDAVARLAEAAERSLLGAHKIGSSINMKLEAMTARAELSLKDMTKQMGADYANISILIVKYGDMCKDLLNDPKNRVEYWRAKFKP